MTFASLGWQEALALGRCLFQKRNNIQQTRNDSLFNAASEIR